MQLRGRDEHGDEDADRGKGKKVYIVILFSAIDDIYADSLYSVECSHRPMVGDLFYIGDPLFGTAGVEVEAVVYVGNNIFHAYCVDVKPVTDHPPYYGVRGVKGSLIAHTQKQMKDFPDTYKGRDR